MNLIHGENTAAKEKLESFVDTHQMLANFNQIRLTPRLPDKSWREELVLNQSFAILENEMLENELSLVKERAAEAPTRAKDFIKWFENLKTTGPGQDTDLFNWLAESADLEQMRWFVGQEVAGEAGFEDLTAMTQVKIPTRAKLEMARNYWDEMGRGNEMGMHGPMLSRIADEMGIEETDIESFLPEALALGNIMLGLAMNRHFAYHSIGALGVIELTAPARAEKVHQGLKRLGISKDGQHYYQLHAAIDIRHSREWNKEVLTPLIKGAPKKAQAIAEGALMRLNAGARCFEQYRRYLGLDTSGKSHNRGLSH